MLFRSGTLMNTKKIFLSLGAGILAVSTFFVLGSVKSHEPVVEQAVADTVSDYYAECEGLTGSALKTKLKSIISKNVSVSYEWSRYEQADEDPNNKSNIITIYARTSLAKSAHVSGSTGWNREHTFPQSKMSSADAKNDNHIIFASDCVVNGKRGNHRLGELTSGTAIKDSYGNSTTCLLSGDIFDPGDTIARGLVARSTMYAAVLYGFDIDENITSYAKCLEWHFKYYPTTSIDIHRNEVVYGNQHNRNPFVDHPEYAAYIWGDHDSQCQQICEKYLSSLESLTLTGTPTKTTYRAGESFDPAGLTVTARLKTASGSYTNEDVTSSVEWSPKTLSTSDTSVTGTYT